MRHDGPRTTVALCGIDYGVLAGWFINKWFKEEDQTRDPEHARPGGKMVSESPFYFASKGFPGRAPQTKWFKTEKSKKEDQQGIRDIAEGRGGCPFDTERQPPSTLGGES